MNCPQVSIKKCHYNLFSIIKEEAFSENVKNVLFSDCKTTAVTVLTCNKQSDGWTGMMTCLFI